MKNLKLFEEIDQFHWENEKDRYDNLKTEMEDLFVHEHTTQEIKQFITRFKEEAEFLSIDQRKELVDLFKNNRENIKIRKFPVYVRNYPY
jgi:hypothetical protein